jgi:hypothetical protein
MSLSPPGVSPGDVPPPILFNPWKHHAGALRRRIAEVGRGGETALAGLPEQLLVIGSELMDLYTGPRSPAEIASGVLAVLTAEGRLSWDTYRPWIEEGGGFRVVTLPGDQTCWVLRLGAEDDRYVHLHPGRWTPETRRVRANVLKTAVMVLACAVVQGGNPRDVPLINRVRRQYLNLAPIKELAGDQGLAVVLDLLAGSAPVTSPPSGFS